VALFVFLSAPAGTRIIAAHFRSGANRFRLFGLGGARLILQFLLLAALAALDFARFVFGPGRLTRNK